uniref:Dynein axonemal assembly factor 4 n=1 Tax=Callorhinchus milii TaxID=7868 RepID=A0A4W3GGI9_CALMI
VCDFPTPIPDPQRQPTKRQQSAPERLNLSPPIYIYKPQLSFPLPSSIPMFN